MVMTAMAKGALFALLSIPLLWISRKSLLNLRSHGFYRFFGWECILWLLLSNYPFWFADPFGPKQLVSWVLLFASIYYVVAGSLMLVGKGKPRKADAREELFEFEKTSELVEQGIFKYIRHPLYGSLMLLTWGIYLKNTTLLLLLVSLASTFFLYLTAVKDEKECLRFFGEKYRAYMRRTRRFIPFVW